jgi:hypothetical protein
VSKATVDTTNQMESTHEEIQIGKSDEEQATDASCCIRADAEIALTSSNPSSDIHIMTSSEQIIFK